MKKANRILAWVIILTLIIGTIGMNPIYVRADGLGSFTVSVACAEGVTPPDHYGVEWKFKDSSDNVIEGFSGVTSEDTHSASITVPEGAVKVFLKVTSAGKEVFIGGQKTTDYDAGDGKEIAIADLSSSYEFQLQNPSTPPAGGGGEPPAGEVGKIAFDINGGGNVSYSVDSGANWTPVGNGDKVDIASSGEIYLKAEPDEAIGKILDTHNQQFYNCNGSRTDITDLDALKAGSYKFSYDSSNAYTVQIRFDGGAGGGGAPGGPSKDVSLDVLWSGDFGDIIVGGHRVDLSKSGEHIASVHADEADDTKIKVTIQAELGESYSSIIINGEEKVPTGTTMGSYEFLIPLSDTSLNIAVTKGASTKGTIVWAYNASDFGADAYVEHGRVEMVSGFAEKMGESFYLVDYDSPVTVRLIPDYGYQVIGAQINGEVELTAKDATNEFTFAMPHGNVHFQGIFTETADIIDIASSSVVSGASFSGDAVATAGGTAKMTINNASPADVTTVAEIDSTKSVQAVDITMNQLFYKNSADDVWSTKREELDFPAEVKLEVSQAAVGYAVLREHNGEVERIESYYDDATNTITFYSEKYSTYTLVPLTINPTPMDGFPDSFGSGTLVVNARDRVDMDNNDEWNPGNMYASGEFSAASLPSGMTLSSLFSQYSAIDFKAKIVEDNGGCSVSEVTYSFEVEIPAGDHTDRASVKFRQGYDPAVSLTKDTDVTFHLDMNACKSSDAVEVLVPAGMTYDDIKGYAIVGIACDFKLNKKGTVSYVAPGATGFPTDTSKPYLNIVIPEMQINGEYNPWGSWKNIKALYNANENKGTGFTTYEDLFKNYKGIKIKVDVSNINPDFNKNNEIFFYLHDPLDGMEPGTVSNGVKYDITDGHTNKQYVRKDGGVQEFTFDFAGTYYMDGDAAPDIWLSMAVESRPSEGGELFDVHYCDIKPVIENANGTVSLGEGCEKMQFTDSTNVANGGLMDVEKATKISLNVSNESDALSALDGDETPSDAKQAELKTLIAANSDMGTDESATEQVKQIVEINLSVDGTEIQPRNNNVKVSIPASTFDIADTSKMKLYHHTGGELVEVTGVVVQDGKISFDTPSFSYFVVVEDSDSSGGSNGGGGSNSPSGSPSGNTGTPGASPAVNSFAPINTSNAGGYGRYLESTMLINDIKAATPGTILTVDRRYNRQCLSNAEMKALLNKKTISLRMQYNYNGVEYDIIINAGTAMNDNIPYYGPLYLAALYPTTNIFVQGISLPFASYDGVATMGVITGIYIARPGDSLYKIARQHGLTVFDLKMKNPQIKNINLIHVGQAIYI